MPVTKANTASRTSRTWAAHVRGETSARSPLAAVLRATAQVGGDADAATVVTPTNVRTGTGGDHPAGGPKVAGDNPTVAGVTPDAPGLERPGRRTGADGTVPRQGSPKGGGIMAEDVAAALTSLAFETLPDDTRLRLDGEARERGIYDLGAALENLSDAPEVPRLVKLDLLVRLAVRRPTFFEEGSESHPELRPFLRSLAPLGANSDAVATLVLDSLEGLSGITSFAAAWEAFSTATDDALELNAMERNKPELAECDDRRVLKTSTPPSAPIDAREVIVRFRSPLTVQQLVDYTDPRAWPDCSAYFLDMLPINPTLTPLTHPRYQGWQAGFLERVAGLPANNLETPLLFQHRRALDGSYARTSYELLVPTTDITYDSGFIEVAALLSASSGMRSLVTAAKVIAFADPFLRKGDWTSYACDTFWIELADNMATDCGNQPVPT
jgi:hypothetical protein